MSGPTTLEHFPDEILIECLGYLNGFDLCRAFDNLNVRFSGLMKSIPLYFNLENVSNSDVRSLCVILRQNPSLKQQVLSLHLSDEKTFQQAEIFLSYFTLREFPSLQSLVLTQVEYGDYSPHDFDDLPQSLPDLSSFVLTLQDQSTFDIPADVSFSKIQRLSIPHLRDNQLMFNQQWLTTSLTLSRVSIEQMIKIFQCATELRDFTIDYLEVKNEYSFHSIDLTKLERTCAIHLLRLCLKTSTRHLKLIEHVLQCTPNLQLLLLNCSRARQMIDAHWWETFIRQSLIDLTHLQFSFLQTESHDSETTCLSKFEQFLGDFWRNEHQWFVRCEYSPSTFLIHTIPYPFNEYHLSSSTDHSSMELINRTSVFDRVNDISIFYHGIKLPCSYSFPNIIKLKLTDHFQSRQTQTNSLLDEQHIECLKSIIRLSNVTDLRIDRGYSFKSSTIMIKLLNETSNISSLTIDLHMFRLIIRDPQVCSLFKEKIKSLVLLSNGYDVLFSPNYSFEQFYQTFSELEELECDLNHGSQFIPLIHSLANLSNISVCFTKYYTTPNFDLSWMRDYGNIVDTHFRCTSQHVAHGQMSGDTRRYVWRFKRRIQRPKDQEEQQSEHE